MNLRSKLLIEALAFVAISAVLVVAFEGRKQSSSFDRQEALLDPSSLNQSALGQGDHENLSINKVDKVAPGFVLLPREGNARVDLLNMQGHTVHSWNVDATRARLLPSGNLLVLHGTKWGNRRQRWAKLREKLIEYDWNGNVVWSYKGEDVLHHDAHRLENGNTIVLRRFWIPDHIKAQKLKDKRRQVQPLRGDAILELDPRGRVLWDWRAHNHFDINSCGDKGCRPFMGNDNSLKKMRDWTHINTSSVIPENKWYEQGHTKFRPGNIITLPRNFWTVYIIDKESKEVVWKYKGDYRGGISGGHEAHMIKKGLPGAGNILVFDNGRKNHPQQSFALEVNPVTKEVVWVYDAGKELYSEARGSVQRLPNGNTLISEDQTGRCFEVTPEKEIVWQYTDELEINRCGKYELSYAPQFKNLITGYKEHANS